MSNCDNLTYWKNNSQPHYGVPVNRTVIPLVRTNGQPGDIPAGYKISLCFLETNALYQSAPLVANSAVAAFVPFSELYVPAGNVQGGERFAANVALSAPVVGSSTDTVSLQIRIADAAGVVVGGTTQTILTLAVPTSGSAKVANAALDFYYDDVANALQVFTKTRSDATYAQNVLASIPFVKTADQRIQVGIIQSDVSHSEVITFTHATIGRVN
jgi:hypothetical protein